MNENTEGYLYQVLENIIHHGEALKVSAVFPPKITIDGDKFCALYGEDLQTGIAGFGKTPMLAVLDYEKNFNEQTL